MIRLLEHRRETVVGDARGCMAVFGSVFLMSGTLAIASACSADVTGWSRLGMLAMGLAHLGGGLIAGWGTSRTAVVTRAGVVLTRRRLFRRRDVQHVRAGEVAAVVVHEGRDSDGDATFTPRLRLTTGRHVELATQGVASSEFALQVASAVARRLEVPEGVDW